MTEAENLSVPTKMKSFERGLVNIETNNAIKFHFYVFEMIQNSLRFYIYGQLSTISMLNKY